MTIPRFEIGAHVRLVVVGVDQGPDNLIEAIRSDGTGWEYQIEMRWYPESDLRQLRNPTVISDIPALPDGVLLPPNAGDGAGAWVDLFVDYTHAISPMTPDLFLVSAALWLPTAVIARRLVLPMPWGDIFTNLFIAWIARSTLFQKTTALKAPRAIAREFFPHLVTPEDFTPEALLSEMAGMDPPNLGSLPPDEQTQWARSKNYAGQRAYSLDEFSGLLASAGKDYNGGMIEALLRLYDCDPRFTRTTRGQGRLVIRNTYLTLLGSTTPSAIAQHLANETLWGNGWWPRFALLTPEVSKPPWARPQARERPAALVQTLLNLDARLPAAVWPNPPRALSVRLAPGVYDNWERLSRTLRYDLLGPPLDKRLYASYGRLPEMALKVATILAALDWPDGEPAPVIRLPHLARAEGIVEDWRYSLHRAITRASDEDLQGFTARVLRHLSRYGRDGQTAYQLGNRHLSDKSTAEVESALVALEERGDIERFEPVRESGGRPTQYWRVLG